MKQNEDQPTNDHSSEEPSSSSSSSRYIVGRDEILQARLDMTAGQPHTSLSQVADLMLSNAAVVTVEPKRTLWHVVKIIEARELEPVPILVVEDGRLQGLIQQKTLEKYLPDRSPQGTASSWQLKQLMEETAVSSLMEPNPLTVLPETPLKTAADKMLAQQLDALAVVDEHNSPVGIIQLQDILNLESQS